MEMEVSNHTGKVHLLQLASSQQVERYYGVSIKAMEKEVEGNMMTETDMDTRRQTIILPTMWWSYRQTH